MAILSGSCLKNTFKSLGSRITALLGTVILGRICVLVCLPLELLLFVCTLAVAVTIYKYKKYEVPVSVYAFVCTLVSFRETFTLTSKSVPCGLCEYRSVCEEDLQGRSREACPSWETEQVKCWQHTKDMDWSLLWVALPALLGTLYFMLAQLLEFHTSKLERWCKVRVMVVIMLPITYAICGFYSLRLLTVNHHDLWTPKAIFDISGLYCAVGLLAFKYLVLECTVQAITKDYKTTFEGSAIDNDTKQQDSSAGDVFVYIVTFQWFAEIFTEAKKAPVARSAKSVRFENSVHNEVWRPLQSISRQLMRMGLLPYVFVCFFGNFAEILMKEFVDFWMPGWCTLMTPGLVATIFPDVKKGHVLPPETFVEFQGAPGSAECEDAWQAAAIIFKVMNFVVCSTAVATLIVYKRNMNELIQGIKPEEKFRGVIVWLLVNFWQSIFLYLAVDDPLKQQRYYSLLVCWEAFLLAVYQGQAYKVEHFQDAAAAAAPSISAKTSIAPTAGLDEMMDSRSARLLPPEEGEAEEAASGCALM
mmetsp:Transcript_62443/g.162268  ORF Transcript_62443/g.162268 Transcript_62443/m.162268 type:complete len:531 (-) Transcript_62443:80-1672(-)